MRRLQQNSQIGVEIAIEIGAECIAIKLLFISDSDSDIDFDGFFQDGNPLS